MVLLHDCKRRIKEGQGDTRLAAHNTHHAYRHQHKTTWYVCVLAALALCQRLINPVKRPSCSPWNMLCGAAHVGSSSYNN